MAWFRPVVTSHKLFSELNKLAEEFIIIEQIKSDKGIQQRQLIAALKSRYFKRFVKESQGLIQEIKERAAYKTQRDFLDFDSIESEYSSVLIVPISIFFKL